MTETKYREVAEDLLIYFEVLKLPHRQKLNIFRELPKHPKQELIDNITAALLQAHKSGAEPVAELVAALERDMSLFGAFLDRYTPEELGNPSQLTGHNAVIEILHSYKRARTTLAKWKGNAL